MRPTLLGCEYEGWWYRLTYDKGEGSNVVVENTEGSLLRKREREGVKQVVVWGREEGGALPLGCPECREVKDSGMLSLPLK